MNTSPVFYSFLSLRRFAALVVGLAGLWLLMLPARAQDSAPILAANAWLLLDSATGQVLAAEKPDERIEPASLTKLMTAYVVFTALREGKLRSDQQVPISQAAWKAPGSRMFIDPKKPVTVDELVRGMIIQSGNDACIALAEAVAGSEATFVERMNREAQRLGLTGTRFANATGLPDAQHYSTARDLARLAQAIINDFPEFYPIYSTREYTYNGIKQPNRNRLLWLDPTVDGVKTGYTQAAGYCLIASSKRGSRRMISVVLGASAENLRVQESLKLLQYGFTAFDAVKLYDKDQVLAQLTVYKGSPGSIAVGFTEDFIVSLPHGKAEKVRVELKTRQPLIAPVRRGDTVATLKVYLGEQPWGEYPVVALKDASVAGLFGRAWGSLRLWLQ